MSKITLTPEVRAVLENSEIGATSLKLPSTPLDRKLYVAVNKVIEAAGGKWNKSLKSHVFSSDPRIELGLALENNVIVDKVKERKKERQSFFTPESVARDVVIAADVFMHYVLEPSAGDGALAIACRNAGAENVFCIDIADESIEVLRENNFGAFKADFLSHFVKPNDSGFKRIVMNPPFTRKSDAKHVKHAFTNWLSKDGLLTSIVCDDGQDRKDLAKIDDSFRIVQRIPAGAFKESGTNIATLVIQLSK